LLTLKRICLPFVIVALVAAVAGCGDDDDDERREAPVEGTFVGKLSGTDALVAVVASPAGRGEDRRGVSVYVSDGKRVSESYTGAAQSNEFTAAAEAGKAEAKGKLSARSATGTIELPDGKTARFSASQATATSGVYDLTVSPRGKLTGASAAGVALTSEAGLRAPGTSTLKFADGKRRKLDIDTTGEPARLRAGRVRLIVLGDGEMRGAGQHGSSSSGGGEPDYFVRSVSG
jgi:hypothetical protein